MNKLPYKAQSFAAAVLGNHCYLCGAQHRNFLCDECQGALPTNDHHCLKCALPMTATELYPPELCPPELYPIELHPTKLCPECQSTEPHFHRSICAFEYSYPLPFLINQYKHHRQFRCGSELTVALNQKIVQAYRNDKLPDLITPVPLHWKRRLHRGFNQAEYIATELARTLKLPACGLFKKSTQTISQQTLTRQDRLKNLTQTFCVNINAKDRINGTHIAIVDDVVTTGATSETLSKLLKNEGVERVDIWALARTPKAS